MVKTISLGRRHRLEIHNNSILIECKDFDRMGKWKTLFCIWKEDIKHFKKAIKIYEEQTKRHKEAKKVSFVPRR